MLQEIITDLNKHPVNIEQYLKDLHKHALQEYFDLIADEAEQQQVQAKESSRKRRKRKRKTSAQQKIAQENAKMQLESKKQTQQAKQDYLCTLGTDELCEFINS